MTNWPHAPPHWTIEIGTYMITAGTYKKEHHFNSVARLNLLQDTLLELAITYKWSLKAWAVFSNHYHFIATTENPENLSEFISNFHRITAIKINQRDQCENRKVWYQYRDTLLTHQRSYFARLNYVINNPVKHGLVNVASHYPYCSAAWFEQYAPGAFRRVIYSFKTDKLDILDDF